MSERDCLKQTRNKHTRKIPVDGDVDRVQAQLVVDDLQRDVVGLAIVVEWRHLGRKRSSEHPLAVTGVASTATASSLFDVDREAVDVGLELHRAARARVASEQRHRDARHDRAIRNRVAEWKARSPVADVVRASVFSRT